MPVKAQQSADDRERERWLLRQTMIESDCDCSFCCGRKVALRRRDERERTRGIAKMALSIPNRVYFRQIDKYAGKTLLWSLEYEAGPAAMAWARKRKGGK